MHIKTSKGLVKVDVCDREEILENEWDLCVKGEDDKYILVTLDEELPYGEGDVG